MPEPAAVGAVDVEWEQIYRDALIDVTRKNVELDRLRATVRDAISRCERQMSEEKATPGWRLWWGTWADSLRAALGEGMADGR